MNYITRVILEMIENQMELDRLIFEKNKFENPSNTQYLYATLDEFGEFNHEMKKSWCWWKQSQSEVDRDKALEELVDVWHFILSFCIHHLLDDKYVSFLTTNKHPELIEPKNFSTDYGHLVALDILNVLYIISRQYMDANYILKYESYCQLLDLMVSITYRCGFNIDEIHTKYMEKNKENRRRQHEGY